VYVTNQMVSQNVRAAASRDKLLSAAAAEFAARGFAGAKVDRIAAKARLNKAMIYYHFRNKAALYREILTGVFRTIADAVSSDVTAADPEDQIRQFVRTIAREAAGRPHFAAMWLRELADGAAHVDAPILNEMQRVLQVLAGIIQRGVAAGQFQSAHPLVVQVSIVGPILVFAASAPARERLAARHPHGETFAAPGSDDLLRHIERAAVGALRRPAAVEIPPGSGRRSRT
jgi:TetR/AcrR family transcriptional regulator